jgi:ATP-dependent RNA helicase DeaD
LTPTRELAEQVAKALKKFSKYKPLEITAVYGGLSINPQISELGDADIVVGTPGRILDHLERRTIDLSNIKTLVLDEADRMLDMGFIKDVEMIIRQCPKKRQTLLFSATIYSEIAHLAKRYMNEPYEVSAEAYVDPKKLTQIYYDVPDNLKFSLLVHLLKNERAGLVMVFCNTRTNTDFVAKNLKYSGVEALAVHGGFSQEKRNRIMRQFHSAEVYVLVCTDVAARGLDIKDVSHVYNYDIPKDSREYIHRIGRTARAGKEGKAISIVASRDYENFSRVQRDNELDIKREQMPDIERVSIKWMGSSRNAGRGFNRYRRRDSGEWGENNRRRFGHDRRESGDWGHRRHSEGRRYSGRRGFRYNRR